MNINTKRPDRYKAADRSRQRNVSLAFKTESSGELSPSIANDAEAGPATGKIHLVTELKQASRDQYDTYYKSGLYDERYPRPNLTTLSNVLATVSPGTRVLDFGCGSGRYAIPTASHCRLLVAYDPSPEAIKLLKDRSSGRTNIVGTDKQDDILQHAPYDVVISLFGVLSHIPGRHERIETLKFLRSVLSHDGSLIVSVPNRLRRFYLEQLGSGLVRGDFSGQIFYHRPGINTPIPYFLYTVRGLRNDLAESGFTVALTAAESILPEKVVTNSRRLMGVEQKCLPLIPATFAYGLLMVAQRG